MHPLLIAAVVLLGACLLLWASFRRPGPQASNREPSAPRPSSVRVVASAPLSAPPGTADLDDVDAVRPEIAAGTLASARSGVSGAVPDSVLADALLDATPDQLRHLFAAVPAEVLAAVVGDTGNRDHSGSQPLRAEDLAALRGVANSVDDLDIWSFAEKG
ncbi:hypothetical protein [Deinococcus sp.]|uniref:hypothetical protein n=1 Tax=Deinococcus sp. TaxID=47478 RepID=UPI003CC53626